MKIAAALLFVSAAASAAGLNPAAASWADFQRSTDPADKQLVAQIQKMRWFDACVAWGREARAKKNPRRMYALQEFLRSDGTINGQDLGHVTGHEPAIGMTACGVMAVMGRPEDVNTTETATRHHQQMIYRRHGMYVYTDGRDANGTVTAIQR